MLSDLNTSLRGNRNSERIYASRKRSSVMPLKIDEASNDLRFVKHVTQSALKNADADSRENIENAIYNLIFKAQFKATGSISMQQTPAGFTLRTYTHATRQKQDEAAQTMGSFMAQIR